jgi:osmotically-inducible protein OsmY
MSVKRVAAVLAFGVVLAGTFALGKPTDFDVLARVGKKTAEKVKGAMPEARQVAGPLAAFRAGDALPVEERVRVRIQTDKLMTGADVAVSPTATAGEVKLRGLVQTAGQKRRAVELAEGTAGVEKVIEELAVPE